jgi:hypothetical protein
VALTTRHRNHATPGGVKGWGATSRHRPPPASRESQSAHSRADTCRAERHGGPAPSLSAHGKDGRRCRDLPNRTNLDQWLLMALAHSAVHSQPWPGRAGSAQGAQAAPATPLEAFLLASPDLRGSAAASGEGHTSCPSTRARISRAKRLASSKVADLPKPSSWPMNTRGAVSSA